MSDRGRGRKEEESRRGIEERDGRGLKGKK